VPARARVPRLLLSRARLRAAACCCREVHVARRASKHCEPEYALEPSRVGVRELGSLKRSSVTHPRAAPRTPPKCGDSCVFSRPKICAPKPTLADGLCDNGQKVRFEKGREP
jgi:hypothetical protein